MITYRRTTSSVEKALVSIEAITPDNRLTIVVNGTSCSFNLDRDSRVGIDTESTITALKEAINAL